MSLYTLGCFFSSVNCIWLGDKLGRKKTIMFGALGNIVGAVLQCTSYSLPQLMVGRLVSGLGYGHLSATAPNWQAECSKAAHRGATVLLEGVFISVGLAIAAWVTYGMSHAAGSVTWRFPLALSCLWSLLVLCTTPQMPESPRWLVKKGRVAEARRVLAALTDTGPQSVEVNEEIAEIEASLALAGRARFSDILHNGELRLFHRACLAAASQMFQQVRADMMPVEKGRVAHGKVRCRA